MSRYFVLAPCLTVIGKPSAALSAKIEGDEKARIAKRKAEMGEEKLKELEKKLEQAKTDSNIPPPSEMISDFPLTDVCPFSQRDIADKLAIKFDLGTCRDGY
jgi:Zn-dependent M16 (insulinase) family peptidase